MDTRKWLTNSPTEVVEGNLAAICLRLFVFWGLLAAPCLAAAALVWAMLPQRFLFISLALLAVVVLLYVFLIIQGIRVFRPAPEKSTDSTVFLVLQVLVYAVFGLVVLRDLKHLAGSWSSLVFVVTGLMTLLDLAFVVIALSARQRVSVVVWAGLAAAVASCYQFAASQLVG